MKIFEIFADRGAGHSARDSGKPTVKWHVKYSSDKGIETKTMSGKTAADIKDQVKKLGGKYISADSMGKE